PIVVKRIKKGGGGAHGGAWKIAYADFVTAMMAFFLLMWLLGSTTKGDLKGIQDYFQNPLKLSLEGGPGSGSATSAVEGGGKDLTRSVGEVANSTFQEARKLTKVHTAPQQTEEERQKERAMLQDLKGKIEALIEANPNLRQFKNQLLIDLTSDGLRLQIVDEQNRPMFDTASATLKPYTSEILRAIGAVLNQVENRLSITGHTDASRYSGDGSGFTNWELSANRANACRRELVVGGIGDTKVMRVVGLASTIPLDRNDPYSAINRRISIIVLNRKAEENLLNEGQELDVGTGQPLQAEELREAAPVPR
ncbi:MAG: flagellar motor protein MotB, partial [Moraxellaceae bacterium]|nr:flagellar motor protein MotB [Moraxellaceae bacterium]